MPRDDFATPAAAHAPSSFAWTALAPAVFVVLWSTGFVAAKAGLPFVEPLTFLSLRFGIVATLMLIASLAVKAPWPRAREAAHIAVVGLLMHGCYLGGVFTSQSRGLPAGFAALIVGLQPILTATIVGPFLGERVTPRQWLGLVFGFGGAVLVLGERYGFSGGGDFDPLTIGLAVLALFGVTGGTLYQKRYCAQSNLWTVSVIQYVAAGIPLGLLALALESMHVTWSSSLIGAMAWLTLVLSIGTVSLLYLLIRRGAVSKITSLFFLIPPVTALMAWVMFGETLGPQALGGMALAAVGVAMVQRG
jgi:drug/metabolite transporter (DMT)-like permease